MTTTTDVPLLTAEQAKVLQHILRMPTSPNGEALDAIATERARVCPVRTKAEWVDALEKEFNHYEIEAILAALRHLNLVAPENGK